MTRTLARSAVAVSFALLVSVFPAYATVKPNALFSDNGILQRGISAPVWGTAANGEQVTVTFQGHTVVTTAHDGRWMVRLPPLEAGGPFVMTIAGENTIVRTNILVGEVWLCSGQSNMEMPLAAATNAEAAIAAAADSKLRFFSVPHGGESQPQTEFAGRCQWQESTPGAAKYFSAVGYFFGKDLRAALKVPVGLIHSSVGGTPAEAWTSLDTLEADPAMKPLLERQEEAVKNFDQAKAEDEHAKAVAEAVAQGRDPSKVPPASRGPAFDWSRPAALYNAMIAPLEPFAMAGVIWYQGESNNKRAAEYQKLFPDLIRDWRAAWKQGDFPFLFVQIAPHREMTPEIREAQLLTWQTVPKTGMAVITDCGNFENIHPTRKQPVGERLALAARAIAYGENIEYSGPVYSAMKVEDARAVLNFSHVGTGLVSSNGALKGFSLAASDGKFLPGQAVIDGDHVIVSNPAVAHAAAVRYSWENYPEGNLFNQEGLPATPFRTDVK